MIEIEQRAHRAMEDAFCRVRLLIQARNLSGAGRDHIYQLSDAAHNIPAALSGDPKYRTGLEYLVVTLEELLLISPSDEDFYEVVQPRPSLFGQLCAAIARH